MRNPRILNLSILFIILNLNLITQILPSSFYITDLRTNSDNSESWVTIINPGAQIFRPSMKWINNSIYIVGQMEQINWLWRSLDYAIYLTKYNNYGVKLWERTWDTSLQDELYGFEVDSSENVYILCTNEVSSHDQPESIFLLKYSPLGELLWAKTLNTSRSCSASAIKLDQYGNIYIAGGVWDDSVHYRFLLKINSTGDILWNTQLDLTIQRLEIDSNNDIYVCGYDSNGFTALYKYNNTGSKLCSINLGEDYISSMEIDSNYNVLITGDTSYYNNNSNSLWVLKYHSSGTLMNNLEFNLVNYDWWRYGRTWVIEDNLYIFLKYPQSPKSNLLKYNSTFQLDWNKSLNEYFFTTYYGLLELAIDVDSHDNTIFCYNNPRGEFSNGINEKFYSSEDISILKLNSSGEISSQYYWGGSYHDDPIQIFIDPVNNVYLLCKCEYVDNWNLHNDKIVLVKNPEINGTPPRIRLIIGFFDYYLFTFLGFMSLVSLILLVSIIKPKLKRMRKRKNTPIAQK